MPKRLGIKLDDSGLINDYSEDTPEPRPVKKLTANERLLKRAAGTLERSEDNG